MIGRWTTAAALTAALLLAGCGRDDAAPSKGPGAKAAATINDAKLGDKPHGGYDPALVKLQVLLDRARFSPGAIDGKDSPNFRRALAAFREARGLKGQGGADRLVWTRLTMADPRPVVRSYVVDADDVAGPFSPKPADDDPVAMAAADQLPYASPAEELAEAFHMDVALLKAMNPKARFRAGDTILVADRGGDDIGEDLTRIEVDRTAGLVRAYGAGGKLVAAYPATVGGAIPAPSGALTVEAISAQPAWDYQSQRPTLTSAEKRRVEIAPGPNNPIGPVWIELSDHRCGIHGAPDPAEVGKPGGPGCVRLTNWDARELARGAMPGAVVSFR